MNEEWKMENEKWKMKNETTENTEKWIVKKPRGKRDRESHRGKKGRNIEPQRTQRDRSRNIKLKC